jgi:hydroxypyruvate isomerase
VIGVNMKLAANLGYLFTERPFLERFSAAAKAGFKGVEILAADVYPTGEIADAIYNADVQFIQFNAAMGDWESGERGIGIDPKKKGKFQDAIGEALEFSRILGNPQLHIMSGVVNDDNDSETARSVLVENLKFAAEACAAEGVKAQIEPINTIDMPGYFLCKPELGLEIIKDVAHSNLYLQYDIYHAQMTEGYLAENIREHVDIINHIQIAGVPGRNEPNVGEINYPFLFDVIDDVGYGGWVSCEYKPISGTLDGLGWAARYGIGG